MINRNRIRFLLCKHFFTLRLFAWKIVWFELVLIVRLILKDFLLKSIEIMSYWKWGSHININRKHKIRDQKEVKKIKENFMNMASQEKFSFNETFIRYLYEVINTKIGMLKRLAWSCWGINLNYQVSTSYILSYLIYSNIYSYL